MQGNTIRVWQTGQRGSHSLGQADNMSVYIAIGAIDRLCGRDFLGQIEQQHLQGTEYLLGMSRTFVKLLLGVVLVGVILLVGAAAYNFFDQKGRSDRRNALVTAYGADILSVCQMASEGQPGTVDKWRFVVIDSKAGWRYDAFQQALAADQQANNRQEATAAICLEEGRRLVETCEYGSSPSDSKTDFTVQRYQRLYNIKIVALDGNRLIASGTLPGATPDACPDKAKSSEPDKTGPLPTAEQFTEWLNQTFSPSSGPAL
jgi:hypothetical protein